MFLFSPKFDWSFSHLPRFNWSCWTLPKCSYFTQMFLNFTQNFITFFSWPKFDEGCWNYHMIPVHSRGVFTLPTGAKKKGKIVSDYSPQHYEWCLALERFSNSSCGPWTKRLETPGVDLRERLLTLWDWEVMNPASAIRALIKLFVRWKTRYDCFKAQVYILLTHKRNLGRIYGVGLNPIHAPLV